MNDLENEFTNLDLNQAVYDELPDFCYVQFQGWMIKLAHKKGLALNELMIYAVIHSFSQDGISSFRGSCDYLKLWASCGRTSVFGKVKKLMDLNLIGREYVTYKGKTFPTYYTYASRTALKCTVTSFQKRVQKSNSDSEKLISEFNSCNEAVQYLNSNSSVFEPNNNLNKDLKKAAAINFLFNKIKENLGCSPYSERFILEMNERFEEYGFDDKRAGEYLDVVTEKVKSKNPNSIHALFKKLVLAEDVIADFILKNPIKKKNKPCECPVCGKTKHPSLVVCNHCGFDFSYQYEKDKVERCKRIFNLIPEDREKREDEIRMVLEKFPVSDFRNIEKTNKRNMYLKEIDRKYRIID